MRSRLVRGTWAVTALGLGLGLVQAKLQPERALFAYAAAFDATVTTALGALLVVAIMHTARARWFVVFRRVALAGASTLPLFLLLFLPVAFGASRLYSWARPDGLDAVERRWAAHAHAWLNVPFFVTRAYVYLAIWSALALVLLRASRDGDRSASDSPVRRARLASAAALPILAATLTAAAFDWIQSEDARWASDMIGLYVFAGAFAGSVGAIVIGAWLAWRAKLLPPEVGAPHFHALGRVALVSVVFWAYIAFCQFLLVWTADLDRESTFYAKRVATGWLEVSVALGVLHFGVPFLLLLSRSLKREPGRLAAVGGCILVAHALDTYWLGVAPLGAGTSWLDAAFFLGLGGLVACVAATIFSGAPPVPLRDPALAEALRYESP
jgi:hypothetical protein